MLLEERGGDIPAIRRRHLELSLGLSSLDLAIVVAELEVAARSIPFSGSYRSPAFVRSMISSKLTSKAYLPAAAEDQDRDLLEAAHDVRAAGAPARA